MIQIKTLGSDSIGIYQKTTLYCSKETKQGITVVHKQFELFKNSNTCR